MKTRVSLRYFVNDCRFCDQSIIYKPGVPICPIVPYNGSPLYSLNKYIVDILKKFVKNKNSNTRNFTVFSKYIRNVSIEYGEIMVSFDVISLYNSIPIIVR